MEKYGELKVACEQVARRATPATGCSSIRPGYVVGPYDYTERFTHWVERSPAASRSSAPDADQPLQCIDGRDLAAFTVGCVERGVVDTFNVTAPQDAPTFREVLAEIARAVGKELPEVTWIGRRATSCRCPSRPMVAADACRPVAHTARLWSPVDSSARDTLAWVRRSRGGPITAA